MKWLWGLVAIAFSGIGWALAGAASAPLSVTGQVLEVRDVENYTYLRLKTREGETWAAVAKAPVKTGSDVTVDNAVVMTDFESKTLKRKFDRIVFGSLAGASVASMHGVAPAAAAGDVKVAKASGPDARTVAEIVTGRSALKDKTVQVRGTVVKFTAGVLGKNWIHLQDGSGSVSDNSNDLLVTTQDQAKPGDVVIVRGQVVTDKDFGSGYSYKVLIADATLRK